MICEPFRWLKISASSLSQLDNKVLLFVYPSKNTLSAAERFASFALLVNCWHYKSLLSLGRDEEIRKGVKEGLQKIRTHEIRLRSTRTRS